MYYIVFNPTAGAGRSQKTLQLVEQHLKNNHVDYIVKETERKHHAKELAAAAVGKGYQGILSVGGDGTLLEIAHALHDTDETLGIIPAGTGNDFRIAVNVPKDPIAALDVILANHSRRVDIGQLSDGRFFLNVAGTGFDVDVIKNTNRVRRLFTGGFAYYLGIVMSIIGYRFITLKIIANGQTIERKVLLIAIANGKCYAGGLQVAPQSSVQDGLFQIVILNRIPKWKILVELPKLARGELEKISCAEQFSCSEITIDCDQEQTFNFDGEVFGKTPLTFSIRQNTLNVFCPK